MCTRAVKSAMESTPEKKRIVKEVRDVEGIVFGIFDVFLGIVDYGVVLTVFSSFILFIVASGAVLVGARVLFFKMIPALIELADPIVLGINAMILALDAFSDTVSVVIEALSFGADTVTPLSFGHLSISKYKRTLKELALECTSYNSVGTVWSQMLVPHISKSVCPYVRAVRPVMGDNLDFLDGFVTTNSDPYGNNCDVVPPPEYAGVCVGLASGYIVLELLLPLLLGCLFFWTTGKSVFKLVWSLSGLVVLLVESAIDGVLRVARLGEKIVMDL